MRSKSRSWRRWFALGASACAALAIVGTLVIFGVAYPSSEPATWNAESVSVASAEAHETVRVKDGEVRRAGFLLRYVLQNNTSLDITIPGNATIMRRLTNGGGLEKYSNVAKPYAAALIPAHQRAQLSVMFEWDCSVTDEQTGEVRDLEVHVCLADALAARVS